MASPIKAPREMAKMVAFAIDLMAFLDSTPAIRLPTKAAPIAPMAAPMLASPEVPISPEAKITANSLKTYNLLLSM